MNRQMTRGRHEADRQRQEDDRLGDALVADPVDEDRDEQAEADAPGAAGGRPTATLLRSAIERVGLAEEPLT